MLSVDCRDGEKGLGLGFVEMEETELEEGEACYYRDDDDDSNYDPDVALSYIDEKLQDVLGHFQKDFEGGVSAENLGSKFGGYGSFLPSYQRSPPILSHPRTPQKVHNHIAPKSPKLLEGALQNTTIPPNASLSARPVPSSSAQSTSAVPSDNSGKRDMFISTARAVEEITPKHDPVNKSVNATEQKTLKVRLKVGGPDNILARNNAAIYSGLGLDISPSSSPEESADESGELQDAPDESPMFIIKIMTAPLIFGESLLSPLPDHLLHLTEKEKPNCRDSTFGTAHKGSRESSSVIPGDSLSVRDNRGFGEKKMKFVEKNGRSFEPKNSNFKDEGKDTSTRVLTKEIDIETLAGRELISKALKLPLLSDFEGTSKKVERQIVFDSVKGTNRAFDISREPNKALAKDRAVSSDFVDEALESVAIQDSNRVRNVENELVSSKGKIRSADKVREEKMVSSQKEISFDPMKDGRGKGDKNFNTIKIDSEGTKGRKDHTSSSVEPPRQKVSQNSTLYDEDVAKMLQGKERMSGGKKKQKTNQSNGKTATELPKEHSKVISSGASKDKKKSKSKHARNLLSEHKSDAIKLHKFSTKIASVESQKDFFGDMKGEQADGRIDILETHCKDRVKESKPEVEKDPNAFIEKSKERSGVDKVEKPLGSEAIAEGSTVNSVVLNGLVSNSATAPVASVVIKENWVCCDKCLKWRLLPFGTNPDHLPKKWLCSMLDWLPGMNRCNFSEEETTKALNALYQVPAPESRNNLHGQLDGVVAPGITFTDTQRQQPPNHDLNVHAVPSVGGKKKHGSRDTLNAPNHASLAHHSGSIGKNQQGSAKSRSLNDVKPYPLESNAVNKVGFQHTSKSNGFAVEKHRHKQKEKPKLLGHCSVEGDIEQCGKHSEMKSKREVDPDGFRVSKKSKTEGLHHTDEDWHSDHRAAVPKLSDAFLTKVTGENLQRDNDYTPFKETKFDKKDKIPVSGKKRKDKEKGSLDGEFKEHLGAMEMDFTEKKRKVRDRHESEVCPETLFTTAHISDNEIYTKVEISGSELKKDKKARVSKSERKESSSGKADGRADKKGSRVTKIVLSGSRDPQGDKTTEESRGVVTKKELQVDQYTVNAVLQRNLDGLDASKRDYGYGQLSMAATSSSSKVSGSHKSKANFQENRGSPVESVSSSPNRSSNAGNLITARRSHLFGKEDSTNVGLSVLGSPRRCSDGDGDGRSDRSDTIRKDKASSMIHHGSLESHKVAESPVLDSSRRACNYQDTNVDQISEVKSKDRLLLKKSDGTYYDPSSTEFEKANLINGGPDTSDQHYQCPSDQRGEERELGMLNTDYHTNGSSQRKSGKGSSSRSRDRHRSVKSEFEQSKVKVSDSFSEQEGLYPTKGTASYRHDDTDNESRDRSTYNEELRIGKYNFEENRNRKNSVGKKDYSMAKCSSEGRKGNHSNFGVHEKPEPVLAKLHKDINLRGGKSDSLCVKDRKSKGQQNLPQVAPREDERSPNYYPSDRNDRTEMTSGRGKSQLFTFSGDKQETQSRYPRATVPRGSRSDALPIDVPSGEALKVPKHPRMPDNHGGAPHNSLRHPTPNRPLGRDLDAPSPVRKDGGQAAFNTAMKEAKDLKHSADRLKNSGSELESTGLYFQAALKFLHGASLLEPCSVESAKHGDMSQSMQVYTDTAKLCEFCAREYERQKEMAAAALAYKCVEVAYMRVIYSKHSSANKDRCELQTGPHVIPPGESPSSSASDVDNLNNSVERGALPKGATSPQIAGNHVIMAHNRPNFVRLLNFAQDVTSAIEALRKSQNAFSAANISMPPRRKNPRLRLLCFNYMRLFPKKMDRRNVVLSVKCSQNVGRIATFVNILFGPSIFSFFETDKGFNILTQ